MSWQLRSRYLILQAFLVIALAAIVLRLWDIQIVSADAYKQSAARNRTRLVSIRAPRGIVYDRTGRLLVRNVPSFAVSIVPAALPDDEDERRRVLERVSILTDVPVDEADPRAEHQESIEERLSARSVGPYTAVRVASKVDRQAAFILEEEHLTLPGVLVEVDPLRSYAEGQLLAHVLGYVGYIPGERLDDYLDDKEADYGPSDMVGLAGIELTQDKLLRGIKGQKHVEVDAFEREVNVLAVQEPTPGHNLWLTVDTELQEVATRALREGMRQAGSDVGILAAIDPRTGEVLAMVSLPSYNNNLFSGGISREDYAALSEDRALPLVNHAISSAYPPGSTFKLVTGVAALAEGVIDTGTKITCPGRIYIPNKYFPDDPRMAQPFACWASWGHGPLNIHGAIAQSCNIFFGVVAGGYGSFEGLGMTRLEEYARAFGFGAPTEIDLSGESSGLIPNDRWKRQNYGEVWATGDTFNAAIGQGYVLVTPLQLLNATAAVANGGTLYRPQLVYRVVDSNGNVVEPFVPDPLTELDVADEHLAAIRLGMYQAVEWGTATLARIPGVSVAGKTGSAEFAAFDEEGNLVVDEEGYAPTHAWFTAFAPYEEPEIALVVLLEAGGEGSHAAVPVAAEVLRRYFGLQPEPEPTASTSEEGTVP
jgi:penicillin-binding protein 2